MKNSYTLLVLLLVFVALAPDIVVAGCLLDLFIQRWPEDRRCLR
jgi:hypothetical protein